MSATMTLCAISSVCRGWEGVNLETPNRAAATPWFNAQAYLGKRGHRFLSSSAKLVLAAARQIQDRIRGGTQSGLYLGTASADTGHRARTIASLHNDPDGLPGAASAPQASANGPAGTLAKTYGVNGPVMTLSGGDDSGLVCLWQAAAAMGRGEISACVVGQVEDQPQDETLGAVLWSLARDAEDASNASVARLSFDGWQRLPHGDFTALEQLADCTLGPVTLIAHEQPDVAELVSHLQTRCPDFEFISGVGVQPLISPDMHLFSLLSLAILTGCEGRILILSRKGHLFSLTMNPNGADNA